MSRSNSGTAEAKQKLDAGDFVGAIVVLEAMPAGLRDNTMLAEAKQRLAHQQLEQQRVTAAAEARRKFDAGDYVGAITVIEAMPTTMRDSAMLAEAKRLVAVQQQCHQNHQRMISLESQLQAAVANHELKQLRPLLTQLVALDPARNDLREALVQLSAPVPGEVSSNSIGMSFAYLPADEFLMGAPKGEAGAGGDEQPQHRVKFTQPFHLGVYQVTQGQFAAVLKRNPSHFQKVSGQQTANFPVEQVTWFDAIEFCNALSQPEGRQPCYQIANIQRADGNFISAVNVTPVSRVASAPGLFGYRLPTEAEWEYACRAGTTTPFHFGKELNGKQANVDGNHPYGTATKGQYLQRTTTVGSYAKNAFGLFDMHGNVWEWCEDVYHDTAYAGRSGTTTDPKVTRGSEFRVLRGGGWLYSSHFARAACRSRSTPDRRSSRYGFRVMCLSVG